MTLDLLWEKAKSLNYPILDRDVLISSLGDLKIQFEGNEYDARDIALRIAFYPLKDASHLMFVFLRDEEKYSSENDSSLK